MDGGKDRGGSMTRDEVLGRLRSERARFDAAVVAIPAGRLSFVPAGRAHSPRDIVAHVAAYDRLIVERLRASRNGETTAFDRDRVGWEAFNERVWAAAAQLSAEETIADAAAVFAELLDEIARLSDEELAAPTGATVALDPAWLDGRAPAVLIGIDGFEHYPMHLAALEDARVTDG
jgi:hypothetical protein